MFQILYIRILFGNCESISSGDLRLTNSRQQNENLRNGILEIYENGRWGSICFENFDYMSARVACHQLRFSMETVEYTAEINQTSQSHLSRVKCRGGESGLFKCSKDRLQSGMECPNSRIVYLNCVANPTTSSNFTNQIRLTGSTVEGAGFVEVFSNNHWQSVCRTSMFPVSISVACKQLGFNYSNAVQLPGTAFTFLTASKSSASTARNGYECHGNEQSLLECQSNHCDQRVDDLAISCIGSDIQNASNTEKLQIAIAMNDHQEVDRLISLEESVDGRSFQCCHEHFKDSPKDGPFLFCAACFGSFGTVESLILNGANVNSSNRLQRTPLIMATNYGTFEMVKTLIDHGADVNAENYMQETALMYAAKYGTFEMVKNLVDNGADVNAASNTKWTALMASAAHGTLEMVKYVIENGADVNATMNDGWTALIFAAYNGASETVKYLVDQGADVNCKNNAQWTPLMYVAKYGTFEMVKYLVDNGADVNAWNNDQWTALMISAYVGTFQMVKYLVDHGADVNVRNNKQWSALILATKYGTFQVVKYLVDHGADVNCKNNAQWTPLMQAAAYGTVEMVKYLVEHGADVNATNEDGWSVLQIARNNEMSELVQYLTTPKSKSNGGISVLGFSVLFQAILPFYMPL